MPASAKLKPGFWAGAMPTLCGTAGRLPELYREWLNASGDLQIGDAFGLEAQWIISQVTAGGEGFPEEDWTVEQIREGSAGVGCVECGDEEVVTTYGICERCR